jgi:hypothetical protein
VSYYTAVSLEIVAHYIVVVLQTIVLDYIVVVAQCYIVVFSQVVSLHIQPTLCMYFQSLISSSPRFCNLCLRVQLTYKSYKMCCSILFDISASGGNDRDHSHVFCKYRIMILLKLKGLGIYTLKIVNTLSCDGLLAYTLYTRHLLFSPFLYSLSTRMLSSSDIYSTLPQLDLYACTSFPLAVRIPTGPHPSFGIYIVSKDNSSVETKN